MSRVGYCDRCHTPSLIGAISTGEEICPRCASIQFNCPEHIIAAELVAKCPLSKDEIREQLLNLKSKFQK